MRVIVHLGAGKTGTTSIQKFLLDNYSQNQWNNNRLFYGGMCFESLGRDKRWKQQPWLFNELAEDELYDEFIQEFKRYIKFCTENGFSTLVISNETFSVAVEKLIPVFKSLSHYADLHLCHYVRSPENWVVSAYQQWCVKHKIIEGPIITASEYLQVKPYGILGDVIRVIVDNDMENHLTVRNMERCSNNNTVEDFFTTYNLSYQKSEDEIRANLSSSSLDEAVFFINNNANHQSTLPHEGHQLLNQLDKYSDEEYLDKTVFNNESFDAEHILDEKKFLNQYLEDECKISLDLNIPDQRKVDRKTFQLASYCVDLHRAFNGLSPDLLRDAAVALEGHNLEMSQKLMHAASVLRPTGGFIRKRLDEYNSRLHSNE